MQGDKNMDLRMCERETGDIGTSEKERKKERKKECVFF